MKRSLNIGAMVAAQLLAAMLTQLLVIRIVGVGPHTDAYIAAQSLPAVLGVIAAAALQAAWLPRLAGASADPARSRREQSIALGQSTLLGAGLLSLGMAGMWLGLPWLFPGFTVQQYAEATTYGIVLTLAELLNVQSSVLTLAHRAGNRFVVAEAVPLVGLLASLSILWFALPMWGLAAAAWVTLGRSAFVCGLHLHVARWPPISLGAGLHCREPWTAMRPLVLGTSVTKLAPWVDRYWASQAPAGAMTTLSLAQTLLAAAAAVVDRAVGAPINVQLARLASIRDYVAFRKTYRRALAMITAVVLPLSVALLGFQALFVELAVEVLNLSPGQARDFWVAAVCLGGYLYAASAGQLVSSSFYALGDTRTPVRVSLVGFAASILTKAAGFLLFQLPGLAAAISAHYIFNMVAMAWLLERLTSEKIGERRLAPVRSAA